MVKEQHAPEVHREIALLNTDNEFNREINEEDIDFNIPGLPHSTVKQLHGASVRELIQKIENYPHRHALQRDLQQSQSFPQDISVVYGTDDVGSIRIQSQVRICHCGLEKKKRQENSTRSVRNP